MGSVMGVVHIILFTVPIPKVDRIMAHTVLHGIT